jgi:hypothetical protein
MSFGINGFRIRPWGLTAIAALATILVAATVEPDGNWLRIGTLPQPERQRLVDNLQKFDLVFSAAQQEALRDLDRKINELDPARKAQYLSTLRRYHNWLNQLPEIKQGELKEKPPTERMALIKKLVADHPLTPAATTKSLQFLDAGNYSPFELAAIYQIWQSLDRAERQQVEKVAQVNRRQNLLKRGARKKIPGEVKPADFDEEKAISDFKSWAQTRHRALLNQLETDPERLEILRRQAINYHFLAIKDQIKPVTTDHLAEFLGQFPAWLRASFDHYPPDEARRRLTVVYRLVFPAGSEIKIGPSSAAASTGSRSTPPPPPRAATSPAGKVPDGPGPPPTF